MNELELFRADVPEQCTPEQARDLTDRIKLVLDGMWELVKAAYTSRAWAALGYPTWDEYCTREFGTSRIRLPREERGEVIGSLRDSGLSLRAIAAATGLGRGTIERELAPSGVPFGTPEAKVHRELAPPEPVERPQRENTPAAATPTATRPATKGLDGRTYQSSRPVQVPVSSVPAASPPLFPADEDAADAEILEGIAVEPEQPADPEAHWGDDERDLAKRLRGGETVVVSLRGPYNNLIRWAEFAGLYVRIDRRTEWGNPFELPGDGDRSTVIGNYAAHYLPYKTSLRERRMELRGKALGCWCKEPGRGIACHGDVLKAWAEDDIDALDDLAAGATHLPHMDEWLADIKKEAAQ